MQRGLPPVFANPTIVNAPHASSGSPLLTFVMNVYCVVTVDEDCGRRFIVSAAIRCDKTISQDLLCMMMGVIGGGWITRRIPSGCRLLNYVFIK
jgi:hypothetical protein